MRIDIEEGRLRPDHKPSWFEWGYYTREGERVASYFLLRLPSYEMKPTYYKRGPWRMHQLCLYFSEPLSGPYQDCDGLRFIHVPCEENFL